MKSFKKIGESPVSVWKAVNTQINLVIAHGMMEHADRYADFAEELNNAGISVYAIHHIGHGKNEEFPLGHWPKNGFELATDRISNLVDQLTNQMPEIPVFLLGHSMGSFIAQNYIARNPKIKGVILSGSNGPSFMVKVGAILSSILVLFNDPKSQSPFLHHMSFDPFQKPFRPNRTSCDWLSRDSDQVDAYVQDNLCGFICTHGFYASFMKGLVHIHKKSILTKIPTTLPVYLFSGGMDPVSNLGKGVERLTKIYKSLGIQDVTMKLYPQGRHEMLNELNRTDVYRDVIDWILTHR